MSSSKNPAGNSSVATLSDSQFEVLVDLLGIDSDDEEDEKTKERPVESQAEGNVVLVNRARADSGRTSTMPNGERQLQDGESDGIFGLGHAHWQAAQGESELADLIDLTHDSPAWSHAASFPAGPLRESTPSKVMKERSHGMHMKRSEIREALESAQREADGLKQRCLELEARLQLRSGVDSSAHAGAGHASGSDNRPEDDNDNDSDSGDPVDNMTLSQARLVLKFLVQTLGLSLSLADVQNQPMSTPPATGRLTSSEIARSIEFVTYVDELVWRRSRLGSRYDNVHGQDNISALKERIELWESLIRARKRRNRGG